MKEATILIVDDDDIDVELLQRTLKKLKIANRTHRATDGLDALEILRGENGRERLEPPYIILLDINMPRMSGLEFLEEVRSDPDLRRAVIFVLTTSDDQSDILGAYDKNIAGYVVKGDASETFQQALLMLDHFWRVVELPT
ncbi:MAG: response regulator [Pseudomonadota bacterium]